MNENVELQFCRDLAENAAKIMLKYFDSDQGEKTKGDGTPVTLADTGVNQMVIEQIKQRFPSDEIVGEEESTANYGKGRRWICDPIDGTAAFVAGIPTAMFSIALVVDGQPTVAVVLEPLRNQTYYAVLDQGSYCNGKKLQVSKHTMKTGVVALAPDYIRKGLIDGQFMKRLLKHDKELLIFPGAVMRSCLVAAGRIAGFPHPRVKPYDIAAVHLIVAEAGGMVTDVHGNPLDYKTDFRGAVISNGVIHKDLLDLFGEE